MYLRSKREGAGGRGCSLGGSLLALGGGSGGYYGVGPDLPVGDQLENVELLSGAVARPILLVGSTLGGRQGRIIIIGAIIILDLVILDELHQLLFKTEQWRLVSALGVLLLLEQQLVEVASLGAAL